MSKIIILLAGIVSTFSIGTIVYNLFHTSSPAYTSQIQANVISEHIAYTQSRIVINNFPTTCSYNIQNQQLTVSWQIPYAAHTYINGILQDITTGKQMIIPPVLLTQNSQTFSGIAPVSQYQLLLRWKNIDAKSNIFTAMQCLKSNTTMTPQQSKPDPITVSNQTTINTTPLANATPTPSIQATLAPTVSPTQSAVPTTLAKTASTIPSGLPKYFSFGVNDWLGDVGTLTSMRQNNGTAWDYRYQYLSGGANTGSEWATWSTPAGQFATDYMQESDTNGYIPTFVYYMMLQSNGPSGTDERTTDLAHLANPSTMQAYYQDWTLLMQKIGAFNKPTVVIVEPDLFGYIEQTAVFQKDTSASQISASVASSGNPNLQNLPNTAQGYSEALLHLRDLYAPNAILAIDASAFATTVDINSDTQSDVNATAIGTQEGSFYNTLGIQGNQSGISSFDLLASDITNQDSAQTNIWWDKYNKTFPNFSRYLQFTTALSAATGRKILMWQVPIGNQYFATMNNSNGHTQDNRAEYILSHIGDFANAGIIGVLFGTGTNGTWVQDKQGDGVTNASPITSYECNQCNTHTSSYPDDDGGYLRIFVGQYYKSGTYKINS